MASLPTSKLVDSSELFCNDLIGMEEAITHSHGPEGEHEHTGHAFTTWLDPQLAIKHARSIREAFIERWPERQDAFEAGFASLERDLLDLDQQIAALVDRDPERPLIGSHPVYQYFARRYELNMKSVHWEPDEAPDDQMWRDLSALLNSHPAKWMIWEGTPSDETAEKLVDMGVGSAVFSPCGNAPEEGDYLSVMRANVTNLEAVFG
jgi:zinc transport system substrate-binding protein